jgi:anti-sigma factor RsiW
MHANVQELLAYRDEEPLDAAVRRHVAGCTECSAEVARLRELKADLRRLASFVVPSRPWNTVRERLEQPAPRPSRYWPALSAGGVMAACLLAFLWTAHRSSLPLPAPGGELVDRVSPAHDVAIEPLVAHSQRLEAILRALPPRPAAEKAVTSATIDELQTRIQLLDLQLSGIAASGADPERMRPLWNARVQLLNSLVYVRYAESAGEGSRSSYPIELGVI